MAKRKQSRQTSRGGYLGELDRLLARARAEILSQVRDEGHGPSTDGRLSCHAAGRDTGLSKHTVWKIIHGDAGVKAETVLALADRLAAVKKNSQHA